MPSTFPFVKTVAGTLGLGLLRENGAVRANTPLVEGVSRLSNSSNRKPAGPGTKHLLRRPARSRWERNREVNHMILISVFGKWNSGAMP
jgi:hypothetical protein